MVNNVMGSLLATFFPQVCRLCGLPSGCQLPLCPHCRETLRVNRHYCYQCALPLPPLSVRREGRICGHCLRKPPAFDRVRAPWVYDTRIAPLISSWKYHRDQRLTPLLADLLLTDHAGGQPPDLFVAVPLHWRRLLWRGFNQSQELVIALARHHNYPLACRSTLLCKRQRYSRPQSGQAALQRSALPSDTFTVRGRCDNLRVALIDDVLTTGATANALASKLKAAGADSVEVWCIARTPPPGTAWT